jgi:hypothetical protein
MGNFKRKEPILEAVTLLKHQGKKSHFRVAFFGNCKVKTI